MRASMEYLLCGTPIVSTYSVGGRDRYFKPAYATIVRPERGAIAAAVNEMAGRSLDRNFVRQSVLSLIYMDRLAFRRTLNRLLVNFGAAPLPSFAPLRGFTFLTRRSAID